jgi:hypothetical protein
MYLHTRAVHVTGMNIWNYRKSSTGRNYFCKYCYNRFLPGKSLFCLPGTEKTRNYRLNIFPGRSGNVFRDLLYIQTVRDDAQVSLLLVLTAITPTVRKRNISV